MDVNQNPFQLSLVSVWESLGLDDEAGFIGPGTGDPLMLGVKGLMVLKLTGGGLEMIEHATPELAAECFVALRRHVEGVMALRQHIGQMFDDLAQPNAGGDTIPADGWNPYSV